MVVEPKVGAASSYIACGQCGHRWSYRFFFWRSNSVALNAMDEMNVGHQSVQTLPAAPLGSEPAMTILLLWQDLRRICERANFMRHQNTGAQKPEIDY